jgi:hypothetical protein
MILFAGLFDKEGKDNNLREKSGLIPLFFLGFQGKGVNQERREYPDKGYHG